MSGYSQMALASCVILTSCDINCSLTFTLDYTVSDRLWLSTVALERGASSFVTTLHIRERYAKYPNYFVRHFYFRVGCGFEQNPGSLLMPVESRTLKNATTAKLASR